MPIEVTLRLDVPVGTDTRRAGTLVTGAYRMMLTFLTVIAAALLGGGLAAEVTLVVVFAAAALGLIAVANGAVLVRRVMNLYDE